tara:strand:+ start:3535 stop:4668 length:1134 start_codon:yes stop_codon:yes gene_type:complete
MTCSRRLAKREFILMTKNNTIDEIRNILENYKDPKSKRPLLKSGLIESLALDKNRLSFALNVLPQDIALYEPFRKNLEEALHSKFPSFNIFVALTAHRPSSLSEQPPSERQQTKQSTDKKESYDLPHLKNIIAIASGKGGVGKSMIAMNLALVLRKSGFKVGLLDLDIYGPSLPLMTGLEGPATMTPDKKIKPFLFKGLSVMSMGFLVPARSPIIWRGPMIQSGVRQLFIDVDWPELDYLLLDLPPGTGDTQLTLAQKCPLSAAVIVSTPQDLALADALKGIAMFEKLKIPIAGLIENMASYICPHCHEESHPFTRGKPQEEAERSEIPFLGSVPLSATILQAADQGNPAFLEDPQSMERNVFFKITQRLLENLDQK